MMMIIDTAHQGMARIPVTRRGSRSGGWLQPAAAAAAHAPRRAGHRRRHHPAPDHARALHPAAPAGAPVHPPRRCLIEALWMVNGGHGASFTSITPPPSAIRRTPAPTASQPALALANRCKCIQNKGVGQAAGTSCIAYIRPVIREMALPHLEDLSYQPSCHCISLGRGCHRLPRLAAAATPALRCWRPVCTRRQQPSELQACGRDVSGTACAQPQPPPAGSGSSNDSGSSTEKTALTSAEGQLQQ
jgi:hypothetical protein